MLQVLGKSSSINVRKVLWTCVELNLPFEQEQWGGEFRSTATPEFTALNPNAMVPVIVDGDFVLWESNTICRYLAQREGRTDLLPADAHGRARVEQWMDWQAGELNNSWRHAFMGLVRHSPRHADPTAIAHSVTEFHRHMAMLDAQLGRTGAYVTGAQFTLADVVLGLSVHRWLSLPVERPELPAVAAYYQCLGTRPGFQLHGRNGHP
ncbi:glutathione S-transferase family protein [Sphaerotilaceae bacterium SBD11-9]